jgi:copper chaperone CopZ
MSATATATLDIAGMHCGSCAALIEETLGGTSGVASIHVDLAANKAEVGFDPETVSLDDLCGTISGLGYGAAPVSS